jgi:signal transduction histidine kinase/CheY-like chemotaxis protein
MSSSPVPLLVDQMTVDNRRLLWELQTINEIAEGISRSLELDDVLRGALESIVKAFDAVGASIRLRDDRTGQYELAASVGSEAPHQCWKGDLRAGEEVLGALTVSAASSGRFDAADERLLAIIAGQIVVAVQNARLHDSIRRGKHEWEQTFDAISDPIAVFDEHRRLLRGNTALAALVEKPVTDIRGATCCDIGLCGCNCPACAVGRALSQGVTDRHEITLSNQQILSVTTFPVDGGPPGVSVVQVAKNVTEEARSARRLQTLSDELASANAQLTATLDRLKSAQTQLLQAEKLSAIGQLVAGVAHELNNPLTTVIGFAQLLESELRSTDAPRSPEDLSRDLQRIAEESGRAAGIVRNLLAFARRQTATREAQKLVDVVQRVLLLRTYELGLNGVELVTEFEDGLPPVIADANQLQQALLNLILNAERAMRGSPVRRLTVGVRLDRRAGALELFVSDTGHGIDHANLSRIFDPFFTTREVGEGTGLGLSICYGIVRDHGGQISVSSRVQVGTTFSILLPARTESSAPGEAGILVAHADQSDRDFITAALSGWGFAVTSTGRSDEAVASYARGDLRAALVDRGILAAELDAWQAATRTVKRRAPLILMSMGADESDAERFGREQASAVLAPPIQLRTLRAALTAVI